MTVFVDNANIEWKGQNWCHMVADSLDELHTFARTLGLQRQWFQQNASYPHYDITLKVKERALHLGAIEGTNARIIQSARALKAQLELQRLSSNSIQLALFEEINN
jgi:hypothetical protein